MRESTSLAPLTDGEEKKQPTRGKKTRGKRDFTSERGKGKSPLAVSSERATRDGTGEEGNSPARKKEKRAVWSDMGGGPVLLQKESFSTGGRGDRKKKNSIARGRQGEKEDYLSEVALWGKKVHALRTIGKEREGPLTKKEEGKRADVCSSPEEGAGKKGKRVLSWYCSREEIIFVPVGGGGEGVQVQGNRDKGEGLSMEACCRRKEILRKDGGNPYN